MKFNFTFFDTEFGFMAGIRRKLNEPIAGITNRTEDGYYVPFLDYDEMPFEWVKGELIDIQKEYRLSKLYVFSSKQDSFHVVSFDKLTREQYQDLLSRSSCDPQYKKVPFTWGRRVATLRATEKGGRKMRLFATIDPQISHNLPKSNAHRIFFEGLYNLNHDKGVYDNYESVIMAKYRI